MKKLIYLLIVLSVLVFLGYKFLNQKEFISSEKSPDGKYIVEIYREKRLFAAPGDGGISGSLGYIRLLDKDGNEIGNSFNCSPFSLVDLELDLGVIDNTFFYTKGGGINLKTGRCD